MQAVVIAYVEDIALDGRLKRFAQEAEQAGAIIICADGGGEAAYTWGLNPRLLVGDMDSISPQTLAELRNRPGLELRRLAIEKDETDLEMALYAALELGATEITVVGGLGGRIDHTLGNLYLLAAPVLLESGARVRLLGEREEVFLIRGGEQLVIEGQPGELLSLIPLGGAAKGVRTDDLYYPLKGETLFIGPTRGVSNVFNTTRAKVFLEEGLLLAIHTFS